MAVLVNGELVLYGFVGDNYWDAGFTAREVLEALAEVGREADLSVRLNSGGGYIDDGIAIFNALSMHKGKVTIHIDAVAASSASIIAMAGDERIMHTGARMMIHDPSSWGFGTAAEMEKVARSLEKTAEQMAGIYAEVTNGDPAAIRLQMQEELWLDGEEAVERGFATGTEDVPAVAAAAFDYGIYAKAPTELRALAQSNAWSVKDLRGRAAASAPATTGQKGAQPMSDKPTADANTAASKPKDEAATAAAAAVAADRTRRREVLALDEAKGREALAEHLYASTEMSVEQIKAALAAAPLASAAVDTDADADPAAYERSRISAAGLAAPGSNRKAKASLNTREIYASRANAAKGN